ncbi:hypothetical protein BDQ17DRAFT_1407372 [Cyathus striatus]|nr:hypothetical protein BDQ17DRAFT_1407372 [Cyathus striatus]
MSLVFDLLDVFENGIDERSTAGSFDLNNTFKRNTNYDFSFRLDTVPIPSLDDENPFTSFSTIIPPEPGNVPSSFSHAIRTGYALPTQQDGIAPNEVMDEPFFFKEEFLKAQEGFTESYDFMLLGTSLFDGYDLQYSDTSDSTIENSSSDWDGDTEYSPEPQANLRRNYVESDVVETISAPVQYDWQDPVFFSPSERVKVRSRNRSAPPRDSESVSSGGKRRAFRKERSPIEQKRRKTTPSDDDDYSLDLRSSSRGSSRAQSSSPARRRFPCHICPQRHVLREDHNPKKKFTCVLCKADFTRQDALKRHNRITNCTSPKKKKATSSP